LRLIFLILIILLVDENIDSQTAQIELRNFYSNKRLIGDTIFVNQATIVLDSLGRFIIPESQDSSFVEFMRYQAYPLLIKGIIDSGSLLVYQFDQYRLMATSLYKRNKILFGLVRRYTYEGGPDEESNVFDIFRYRDRITLLNNGLMYEYSFDNMSKEFLILKIEKN